eukprot:GFYU01000064.1.p1 GENE.GFYU01000064.1~~GFYU01000064.1.p1  ORF type:complete len:946 (-),score=362.31 GFYU01000064.1:351-3188(-)
MVNFGISAAELVELRQSETAVAELKKLGGVSGVAQKVSVNLKEGLSDKEKGSNYDSRRNAFGSNEAPDPPVKTFLGLLWEALQDTTLIILVVSAVISLFLGITVKDADKDSDGYEDKNTGWIEGAAILLAVAIVSLVTAGNDYQKEQQFRALNKVKENKKVKVLRGGQQTVTTTFDLTVGDIVVLDTGDAVPADGLYIEGHGLVIDESAMTGESEGVQKSDGVPFMLSGCQVSEGIGKMMVTCVGTNSEWGMTLANLSEEPEDTPLQAKLGDMAEQIGWGGLAAAVLTFLALTFRWALKQYYSPYDFEWSRCADLVDFVIIAITIVVVAVPEGLPLAVTISLAYSMQKMMADNNLVRKLEACETMGGATDICSDKTGTLTENRMTVTHGSIAGKYYDDIDARAPSLDTAVRNILADGIAINSNASISRPQSGRPEFIGNKTECALLYMCQEAFGTDYNKTRAGAQIVFFQSFSSARKSMSVVVTTQTGYRIWSKGAAEILLNSCSSTLNQTGGVDKLNDGEKGKLHKYIEDLAKKGLRVVCMTYQDLPKGDTSWKATDGTVNIKNHTLVAIVGIKDPLRKEVIGAVEQCKSAGINVRMVTGDNKMTAEFIAREAGILTKDGVSMEGPKFRMLSDDEKDKIIPKLQVLSRSSPHDKYVLTERLKKMDAVVAVTGDGTNDAPALKKADVGLSMGIAGTEVAKEASDIVLLDDNFASIVKSVMWGRCVYDNIRKFLQFQLTVNVVALTTAFIAAIAEFGTPLTAVQLLWVNLIMDTMAALALATEPPSMELLKRAPYGRHDALISARMWRNVLFQAAFQLVVQYFVLVQGPDYFGVVAKSRLHYTIAFNAFVFCQVFNNFNSRRLYDEHNIFEGVFDNSIFVGVIVVTVVVQYIFIEVGGEFTQCASLTNDQWFTTVALGSLAIPLGFVCRMIPISDDRKVNPGKKNV